MQRIADMNGLNPWCQLHITITNRYTTGFCTCSIAMFPTCTHRRDKVAKSQVSKLPIENKSKKIIGEPSAPWRCVQRSINYYKALSIFGNSFASTLASPGFRSCQVEGIIRRTYPQVGRWPRSAFATELTNWVKAGLCPTMRTESSASGMEWIQRHNSPLEKVYRLESVFHSRCFFGKVSRMCLIVCWALSAEEQ